MGKPLVDEERAWRLRNARAHTLWQIASDAATALRRGESVDAVARDYIDRLDPHQWRDMVMLLLHCLPVHRPLSEVVGWTRQLGPAPQRRELARSGR